MSDDFLFFYIEEDGQLVKDQIPASHPKLQEKPYAEILNKFNALSGFLHGVYFDEELLAGCCAPAGFIGETELQDFIDKALRTVKKKNLRISSRIDSYLNPVSTLSLAKWEGTRCKVFDDMEIVFEDEKHEKFHFKEEVEGCPYDYFNVWELDRIDPNEVEGNGYWHYVISFNRHGEELRRYCIEEIIRVMLNKRLQFEKSIDALEKAL